MRSVKGKGEGRNEGKDILPPYFIHTTLDNDRTHQSEMVVVMVIS